MIYTIRDPQGLVHILQLDGREWFGYENIAHGWEPIARRAIIEQTLAELQLGQLTLSNGFTYAS